MAQKLGGSRIATLWDALPSGIHVSTDDLDD